MTSYEYVKCNICGVDDFSVLFDAGKAQIHRIVKCKRCSLLYANPQTDNVSAVEKIHLKPEIDNFQTVTGLENFNPENHQYLKKQYLQIKDYSSILDFLDTRKKGILLEVGSYAGVFLNEAKNRGWEVLGIEPLEVPANYAEEYFNIKVIKKYFEQVDIKENSIDVITSCHVIEHVPDPSSFVQKAYRLLRSGGNLILETPTYDSFMFKVLRHRERSVRCEGHLYFFTKKTLSILVENCGFKVVKHEKVGRTLTFERLFYNLGVITGKVEFFSKISKILKLDKYVVHINMRDMQRIYCQKH